MGFKTNNQHGFGDAASQRVANHPVGYWDVTIGTEAANKILVTLQAKNLNSDNYDGVVHAIVSVYSNQTGTLETDTPIDAADGDTVGTEVVALTSGIVELWRSNSEGKIVLKLGDTGTDTFYLECAPLCGGAIVQTDAITFAA